MKQKEWNDMRLQVLKRDGRKCKVCKRKERLDTHHKIPKRLGGNDDMDNLIILCPNCHNAVEYNHISDGCIRHLKRLRKDLLWFVKSIRALGLKFNPIINWDEIIIGERMRSERRPVLE